LPPGTVIKEQFIGGIVPARIGRQLNRQSVGSYFFRRFCMMFNDC